MRHQSISEQHVDLLTKMYAGQFIMIILEEEFKQTQSFGCQRAQPINLNETTLTHHLMPTRGVPTSSERRSLVQQRQCEPSGGVAGKQTPPPPQPSRLHSATFRMSRGAFWARYLARVPSNCTVFSDHRPLTSAARTTRRARLPAPFSSGYVLSFFRLGLATPQRSWQMCHV